MRRNQNQCISARKAAQKHGFRTEIQNELVREPRTKFLHFRVRKALQTLQFLNEIACRVCIFCQKTQDMRPFHSEKQGPEVMVLTRPGRSRDLADPLAPLRSCETAILAVPLNFRMVLATCWQWSPGGERSGGGKPFPHQRGLTFRPRVSGFPTYNNGAPSKRPPSSVRRLMAVIEQRTPSRVIPKQRIKAIAQRRAAQAPRPGLKHSTLHFCAKIRGHVPPTEKSKVIFKKHAR